MHWVATNWHWVATAAGLYLLLDIANSLRAIHAEMRRPADEAAVLRMKHGVEDRAA